MRPPKMKRCLPPKSIILSLLALILSASGIPAKAQSVSPNEDSSATRARTSFNADWLFHRGDPADLPKGALDYATLKDSLLATGNDFSKTHQVTAPAGNPGSDVSFVRPEFDDSGWRKLNLPHDWAIEGPFDIDASGDTGKLPYWGQGWYRKHFTVPSSDEGRRLFLGIDGAMSYSEVWVNGHFAGGWPYGYSSYQLDITPFLKFGGENTISIRLDNPKDSSRWYPGAGIYRNVWLTRTSPVHIAQWGTYLTTPQVSKESATINLRGTIQNQGDKDAVATASTEIYELDPKDHKSAAPVLSLPTATATVAGGKSQHFEVQHPFANPKLWDTVNPHRYVAVTTVSVDGKPVDRYETPFGIRSITFDPEKGFLLNGKHVPLNGVCGHHDLGALGAAFNTRAAERQLQILKEMGVNALRTSHNMPAPELLDLCDKLGILVMDESFDCWANAKKSGDYHLIFADWHERDLRSEYRRDRNHPSVIIWSLGNEIPEQGSKGAAPLFAELIGIAHDEDPTRPTTLGANGVENFDPAFANLFDLAGENYDPGMYAGFHKAHPGMPLFGSETASTCSSRGVYFFPPDLGQANFQINSYDGYFPGWAELPDVDWRALDDNPFVAGEFVWTGFDYLGEPTPYNGDMTNLLNFRNDPVKQAEMAKQLRELGKIKCPSRSSYFGIVDLSGFKKDRFYLYQSRWRPELPMVHILPHWNWPGHEGQVIPVYVYTSGDEAELFLNGKSLGKRIKEGRLNLNKGNLALNRPAQASSEETVKNHLASNPVNGNKPGLWVASSGDVPQWWQVDLGSSQKIREVLLSFESDPQKYQYTVLGSDDGSTWKKLATSDKADISDDSAVILTDATARYLKIEFTGLAQGSWASLGSVRVFGKVQQSPEVSSGRYRLVWNNVVYQPGELKAVAYKDGKKWAEETVRTTGAAAGLKLDVDRPAITNDGLDLAFVTARVVDSEGVTVPVAQNSIHFEIKGPGEIVATDNGDATDLNIFSHPDRKAFNGLALAIVRAKPGETGKISLTATSEGLKSGKTIITTQ